MTTKTFHVSTKNLIALLAVSSFFIIIGALGILNYIENVKYLLYAGVTIYFFFWLIVMLEIVNSNIENKIIWILLMVLFPGIVPIVYLLVRNKIKPLAKDLV